MCQGETDENSVNLNFIRGNLGSLTLDPLNDCTQGSLSCISRTENMHESTLHGMKKRKVATPVVVCCRCVSQIVHLQSSEIRI